jgi:hypothetical protein
MKTAALCLLALSLAACGSLGASTVVQQASFDHNCPKEKIQIEEENASIQAYRLKVCGVDRKYRDRGTRTFQFVDVTNNPAQEPAK